MKNYTNTKDILNNIFNDLIKLSTNVPSTEYRKVEKIINNYNVNDIIFLFDSFRTTDINVFANLDSEKYIVIGANAYSNPENIDEVSRLVFKINDEYRSIYDLLGKTPDDMYEMSKELRSNISKGAIYSYFTLTKRYDLAYKFIDDIMNTPGNEGESLYLESHISSDYVAFFNYIIDKGLEPKNLLLERYLNAAANKNSNSIPNILDRKTYSKVYMKFKNQIKKINYSQFFSNEKAGKNLIGEGINPFDVLESDFSVRERLFRVFDNNAASIVKALIKINSEKLIEIAVEYFNQEHGDGRKKAQFLSSYNRLRKILERQNVHIDTFKFTEKLQSYILLEMMS